MICLKNEYDSAQQTWAYNLFHIKHSPKSSFHLGRWEGQKKTSKTDFELFHASANQDFSYET